MDNLTAEHVQQLVVGGVQEEFDLDFKQTHYGRGDSDRRALAADVAAMANTAGGLILIGVAEDDQARAVAAPGVELSDAETARVRQVVASHTAPMPYFDIISLRSPGSGMVAGFCCSRSRVGGAMTEIGDPRSGTCACCGERRRESEINRLTASPDVAICGGCVELMSAGAHARPTLTPIFPVRDMAEASAFWTRAGVTVELFDPGYAFVLVDGAELAHLDLPSPTPRHSG